MKEKNQLPQMRWYFFVLPALIGIAGLILVIVSAPETTRLNSGVVWGILLMCLAGYLVFFILFIECKRTGREFPGIVGFLFPEYPEVKDKNALTENLSGFRKAYGEFLNHTEPKENSTLQSHASQMLWHSLSLQKRRMQRLGLTQETQIKRVAFSTEFGSVRHREYFDGRYAVSEVYEEISAIRDIVRGNKVLKRLHDNEVAHYTILSAKEAGEGQVICPNCGSAASRDNLIDGCDFCGTKFTVEDLENRVDSFGFRRDIQAHEKKKEAVTGQIIPWILMVVEMPLLLFGFLGPLVYATSLNIIVRLIVSLICMALFGLVGGGIVFLAGILVISVCFVTAVNSQGKNVDYAAMAKAEKEKYVSDRVRKFDRNFSIQSFYGNVQNKLSAIHFADTPEQINAFSEPDLSSFLKKYESVVDMDVTNIELGSYKVVDNIQIADVAAELLIRTLEGDRLKENPETVKMQLIKSGECKTQVLCGPAVFKCQGCGLSISLMDGKRCPTCDHELDLKQNDWVIKEYRVSM